MTAKEGRDISKLFSFFVNSTMPKGRNLKDGSMVAGVRNACLVSDFLSSEHQNHDGPA